MRTILLALSLPGLSLLPAVAPAAAQPFNAPPIPPDLILRQQNAPLLPPPSVPVPATRAPVEPGFVPPRAAPADPRFRDRAAACQHQATVDRVPRRHRGSYINNCINQ